MHIFVQLTWLLVKTYQIIEFHWQLLQANPTMINLNSITLNHLQKFNFADDFAKM